MWNLKLLHRLFCLLVTLFMVSHVCWHVLSPGADINQYSAIAYDFLCFIMQKLSKENEKKKNIYNMS